MRKIWCSWNTECSSSSSSSALSRSRPNGFSMTSRRNVPGGSSASPAAPSRCATFANAVGTVAR